MRILYKPLYNVYVKTIYHNRPYNLKEGYTRGARQFIERFKVGLFVPMLFVASGFKSAWRMKKFTDAHAIPFWKIEHEGEQIGS